MLLQLLLAFQIGSIALFHVLVHSLQPLFVLLHALGQIVFSLLLFFEYIIIIHLLHCFPFGVHLFLNVQNQAILVPDALQISTLDKCIPNIITPDTADDFLYVGPFYAVSLLLNDFEGLNQVLVLF